MNAVPTPEQQEAIDCNENVVVTARPGSGKTFTLARMIARESKDLLSYQGVIAISYTNKASDELEERCKVLGVEQKSSFFGTIDSFCLSQLVAPFAAHISGCVVDMNPIEDKECEEWLRVKELTLEDSELTSFVLKTLTSGIIPLGALGPAALLILERVPQASRFIKARYTSIFIDEYQDCGHYQHLLMKKMISYGLRGIAVGDIDQAIFRFADKSPEYLRELIKTPGFKHFQITENHRCDKAIQAYSLKLLGLSAPSIARNDRRVFVIDMLGDEETLACWMTATLDPIMQKYKVSARNNVAIIGFGNKVLDIYGSAIGIPCKRYSDTPLDRGFTRWRRVLADLLRCYYDPSRFSGFFLDKHISPNPNPRRRSRGLEFIDEFFALPENALVDSIDLARKIAELCEPKAEREGDIDAFYETVGNLDVLRGGYRPAQPSEVNILTYHKAKGLEFDVVFCMETYKYVMPPYKYEEKDYNAYEQFLAMHYVGITRARKVCYLMLGSQRHNAKDKLKDAVPSQYLSLPGLADLRIYNRLR